MNNTYVIIWLLTTFLFVLLLFMLSSKRRRVSKLPVSKTNTVDSQVKRGTASKAWIPENLLEEKLELFRNNEIGRSAVVNTLLSSEVLILTKVKASTDPSVCPSKTGGRDSRLIPLYSSISRLKRDLKTVSAEYSHVHRIKLKNWLSQLPVNYGVVVNPGIDFSIEILPDDVAQLKLELS